MSGGVTRINLWSGPRNVSTALMYSFAERGDTRVVDEPLYAHYLARTDVVHPGEEDVLAAQDHDGNAVVRDVILGPCDRPVLFAKQMAHHIDGLDRGFLRDCVNVLLIRDPREMLTSLVRNLPAPSIRDTGLSHQTELLSELDAMGVEPPIVDSRLLLLDPPRILCLLCERIGIPFDEDMLAWEPGPRAEDGVWAPHWYARVHESTGFAPYRRKEEEVPEALLPLLDECLEHYGVLVSRALGNDTTESSS